MSLITAVLHAGLVSQSQSGLCFYQITTPLVYVVYGGCAEGRQMQRKDRRGQGTQQSMQVAAPTAGRAVLNCSYASRIMASWFLVDWAKSCCVRHRYFPTHRTAELLQRLALVRLASSLVSATVQLHHGGGRHSGEDQGCAYSGTCTASRVARRCIVPVLCQCCCHSAVTSQMVSSCVLCLIIPCWFACLPRLMLCSVTEMATSQATTGACLFLG